MVRPWLRGGAKKERWKMSKLLSRRVPYMTGLSAVFLVSFSLAAGAQTKLIKRNGWFQKAPIEVFDLKVKDQSASFNQAFEAGPDWVKDVSFKIKNNSEKTIVSIWMGVVFRDTGPPPME